MNSSSLPVMIKSDKQYKITGSVVIDGKTYELEYKDGIYVGMGAKEITFASKDASNPAKFYINSTPAHKTYPTVKITLNGEDGDGVIDALDNE